MENKVRKYAAMQLAEMQYKANPEDKQLAEAFETAKSEYEKIQDEDAVKAEAAPKAEVAPKAEAAPKADEEAELKATAAKKK